METFERGGEFRIELFVRSELPPPAEEQSERLYERLAALSGQSEVAGVGRTEWVSRTPVEACDTGLRDTYLGFEAWASDRGVSLQPFFGTRECYSTDRRGRVDWLVLPALCLAVYRDGAVSAVYPHRDGAETETVADGVAALERDFLEVVEDRPALAD